MQAGTAAGVPVVVEGMLVSTNPASGAEAGRLPVATPQDVSAAVARAGTAASWWRDLGFAGRRARLLRFRSLLANRIDELSALMHLETAKPRAEAIAEVAGGIEHIAWSAKHARRVLRPRRVRSSLLQFEYASYVEYQPYGVVGVIGPWNYPVLTPMGTVGFALAAGNAVVFKPSEYTPAIADWLVARFTEVVPEQPVLQVVHGLGDVGAALCRAGVDKVAFTGSTPTGRKVMAACAETLTPVLLECGGKDAMIVDADADIDAAAESCLWGGMTNAGQSCVGIERVYIVDAVYDAFLSALLAKARRLRVGADEDADFGPVTMPGQLDIIRRHIDRALADGGRAALGGADAVAPPYVYPTILVDVPESSEAVREETFGPTLTVRRVADADEALELANASAYGLGGAVFGHTRAMELARRMRSGMTSVNSALSFAGMSAVPFGGVGLSGFGRTHGDDGLREFCHVKSITRRRFKPPLPALTFERTPKQSSRIARAVRLLHGRSR